MTNIIASISKGEDLLFITDICRCNSKVFVETLSEPTDYGRWIYIDELIDDGWDLIDG